MRPIGTTTASMLSGDINQKQNKTLRKVLHDGRRRWNNSQISDILRDKRRKLLGHIIRRPRDHPQHEATFATRTPQPRQVQHRRVGRPRAAWTYKTMQNCWLRHTEHSVHWNPLIHGEWKSPYDNRHLVSHGEPMAQ